MSINQSLRFAIFFRFAAVAINLGYYALITRYFPGDIATTLFLYITIITSSEMIVCGALEPQVMQRRFGLREETAFYRKVLLAVTIISIAVYFKAEFVVFVAVAINSCIRHLNAKARMRNKAWALIFDGQFQAVMGILIALFCFVYCQEIVVFVPLLVSIVSFLAIVMFFIADPLPRSLVSEDNSHGHGVASIAIYLQFINSSVQSIMIAMLSGTDYRSIFMAQRFGDSINNFSRILQWVGVEKIQSGGTVYGFSRNEMYMLLLLVISVIALGFGYGYLGKLDMIYYYFLPAFSFVSIAAVMQARLTQVMIRDGQQKHLLIIRMIQLAISLVGVAIGLKMSSIVPVIIFSALSHLSAYGTVNRKTLTNPL